jgi:hypothetical protein
LHLLHKGCIFQASMQWKSSFIAHAFSFLLIYLSSL